MKRIVRHIPSLLLGACFVASGWLKGVARLRSIAEIIGVFPLVGVERLCD